MYEMHPGETLSARQLHNSCAVSPGITAGPPMRQVRARSGSCPNHSASGLQPSARRHLAAAALSLSARDGRSHFLTGSRSRHERRERTTSRPLANGTVVDRPQRLEHGALLVARTWDPTWVVAGGRRRRRRRKPATAAYIGPSRCTTSSAQHTNRIQLRVRTAAGVFSGVGTNENGRTGVSHTRHVRRSLLAFWGGERLQ